MGACSGVDASDLWSGDREDPCERVCVNCVSLVFVLAFTRQNVLALEFFGVVLRGVSSVLYCT